MNKFLSLSTSSALILSAFLVTGCSSSGDGGGGTATVPANAVVIDSANAEAIVQTAASSGNTLGSALAVETTQIMSLQSALNSIQPLLKNVSTAHTATGVDFTEPCTNGGSISGSGTNADDGTTYTDSGTASFNSCNEGGFIINGSMTFSESGNYVTGDYTADASGSITMTFNNESGSGSFSFTGFVLSETGNYQDFTYSINQLTYAIDFVTNGSQGGGFLVSLTAPIVESNGDFCPESGHITITGANGTTAEGIYNGDGVTMTIKANGTVVNASATCYG